MGLLITATVPARVRVALLCTLLGACAPATLRMHEAWIPLAPPGVEVLAGYLRIDNGTDAALVLNGASSPLFARIELHGTQVVDGVARMRRETAVTVPAGGQVDFAPGGRHLMLFGPRRALRAGEQVPVQLRFDDGRSVDVRFEVRERGLRL